MINKKNLSQQIYETIRKDILAQNIQFGEKLVNRDLQVKFGVSSTPIRDAINRLYQDGLVEDISQGGARVITFDYESALEINEIVLMLNREAVKLSARRAELLQLERSLEQNIRQQSLHIQQADYLKYDFLFHRTFFDFCGNSRLADMYTQYHTLWEILVMFYYTDQEKTRSNAIQQHQQILDAFKAKEFTLAQQCMDRHFEEAARPFSKALQGRLQKG